MRPFGVRPSPWPLRPTRWSSAAIEGVIPAWITRSTSPTSIPSTLVVDRQGRMAASVLGQITEASLRDLVTTIAAEQTSPDGAAPAADDG